MSKWSNTTVVEKEWVSAAGYRCEVVFWPGYDRGGHRYGYVGIPKGHPLYGVDYGTPSDKYPPMDMDNTPIGERGAIPLFCFDPQDGMRGDVYFNVHGSLTFSSMYEDIWWFGYDCAHYGDTPDICTLDYCITQCELLAEQLKFVENYWRSKQYE